MPLRLRVAEFESASGEPNKNGGYTITLRFPGGESEEVELTEEPSIRLIKEIAARCSGGQRGIAFLPVK